MSYKKDSILIVEDSNEDYEITSRALSKSEIDCTLYRCSTGEEAIRSFLDNKEDALPSLILLDLNLPGLSGQEVLEKIKGEEALKKLPVIILSTSNDCADVNHCYKQHANSYIQKPVHIDKFIEAINSLNSFWLSVATLPKENSNE